MENETKETGLITGFGELVNNSKTRKSIQIRLNDDLILHINYKWNNHFSKEVNTSAICNQIKEIIINSFIR